MADHVALAEAGLLLAGLGALLAGMVTDLGIKLRKLVSWNRRGVSGGPIVLADRTRLRVLSTMVSCFFASSAAAGWSPAIRAPAE